VCTVSARTLPGCRWWGALYLRISDDRAGRQLGVERQEKDLRDLFARLGIDMVSVSRSTVPVGSGAHHTRHLFTMAYGQATLDEPGGP
jgi:hypothetical protein